MNDTFLKACRGESVPYTPVWIMRQAGRSLPQFRELIKKTDFLTICRTPELAAEVTIQPVDVLGVDAAILFSDILTTVEPMGMQLIFSESKGLYFENSVRSAAEIEKLIVTDPEETLSFVMESIKILVQALQKKVPLIGFAGAPFSVAAYMVEGIESLNSQLFAVTRKMMAREPGLFHSLLDKVNEFTTSYLKAQIKAGAPAVMLFDSWGGLLCPRDYQEFILRYIKQSIAALKSEGVPIIYYVKGCAGLLNLIKDCGADIIGIDGGVTLEEAVKQLGPDVSIQGNLDPFALFMPKARMEERVKEVLAMASDAGGHIFNLGIGLHPATPVENIIAMIDAVHKFSKR